MQSEEAFKQAWRLGSIPSILVMHLEMHGISMLVYILHIRCCLVMVDVEPNFPSVFREFRGNHPWRQWSNSLQDPLEQSSNGEEVSNAQNK